MTEGTNGTNLAGATQPLGRRTIFLGHGSSYLSSPLVTFLATIPFSAKNVSLMLVLWSLHYVSLTTAERDACILEIVQRTSLEDGAPQRFA